MKNLMVLFLTISICICFLTACEKESNVVPNKYKFEGEWSWVKTTFGWSAPLYPDSLGHSPSLIIDHSDYTMLTDDVITDRLKYELKMDTNNFGNIIEYILLETGKRYNIYYVDSVNLVLDENLIDGAVWYYVRK